MSVSTACSTSCQLVTGRAASRPAAPQARQCVAAPQAAFKLRSSSLHGRQLLCTAGRSFTRQRASAFRVHANAATDVFKYLSEAASSIFSPMNTSTVNWEGTGSAFTGDITHHDNLPKLRKLHQTIIAAREQLSGCMDPNAANFDPSANTDDGSCEYVFTGSDGKQVAYKGDLGGFVTSAIGGVVGGNFSKGGDLDWKDTTFNYSGDIVSQRDITRLLAFEKVVKSTLDTAEKKATVESK